MKRQWLYAALVAFVFGALGCGAGAAGGSGLAAAPQSATGSPTPPSAQVLRAADVKLTIQTTKKDCFGEAGCSLQYRVRASWPKELVSEGTSYEVAYEVRGVEDGPQIGLLTIHDDGTVDTPDEFAMTTTSGTKLVAKVTGVEAR